MTKLFLLTLIFTERNSLRNYRRFLASLAQLVEQLALNQLVGGSNPSRRTFISSKFKSKENAYFLGAGDYHQNWEFCNYKHACNSVGRDGAFDFSRLHRGEEAENVAGSISGYHGADFGGAT